MLKKLASLTMALLLALTLVSVACAAEFNYLSADQVAEIIKNNDQNWILIDIQPESNFNNNHLQNVIPTYAFPVDTPETQAKLMEGIAQAGENQKIIIICPGGKTGAANSVNYLTSQGFANDRLYILQNGQNGWPSNYQDLLAK